MIFAQVSETMQLATLAAGVLTALISAVSVAYGAWLAFKTGQMRDQLALNTLLTAQAAKTATEVKEKVEKVETRVETVIHATDGMKTELVAEVRKAAYARGVKSEVDKQDAAQAAETAKEEPKRADSTG
jgi:hypothetical protein